MLHNPKKLPANSTPLQDRSKPGRISATQRSHCTPQNQNTHASRHAFSTAVHPQSPPVSFREPSGPPPLRRQHYTFGYGMFPRLYSRINREACSNTRTGRVHTLSALSKSNRRPGNVAPPTANRETKRDGDVMGRGIRVPLLKLWGVFPST